MHDGIITSASVDENNVVASLLDVCERSWKSGLVCLLHKRRNDIHEGTTGFASCQQWCTIFVGVLSGE
jgi:hypothetical protein